MISHTDGGAGFLKSTPKKQGRKTKPYPTSWGENIDGLYREPDGRWRITLPGPHFRSRFTEADERFAVARFKKMMGQDTSQPVVNLHVPRDPEEVSKDLAIVNSGDATQGIEPYERALKHFMGVNVDERELWAYVREQILMRPLWVAEQTGIEQIGYLQSLKKPTRSPSLVEVGKLYHEKSGVTGKWARASGNFWDEFIESVEVKTLREVTQEKIAEYKAEVLEAGMSVTYIKHRFGQIKTIIAYSAKWGKWLEDRAMVLAYCSILTPPSSICLDPMPISRADFHKLLTAATSATNRLSILKPLLLLSLNACLYAAEVADVRWDDLDLTRGYLVMDRGKTQVVRAAVLWPETVEALKALPRIDGIASPFLTAATRQGHNANTITKYYRQLRKTAGVCESVKFAHVRDGAYTAACQSAPYDIARILGGHRCGMADHYVKRNPKLVSPACDGVRKEYFG
jgi:integrase